MYVTSDVAYTRGVGQKGVGKDVEESQEERTEAQKKWLPEQRKLEEVGDEMERRIVLLAP